MQQMQCSLEGEEEKIFLLDENRAFRDEIEYDSALAFRNIYRVEGSYRFPAGRRSVAGCLSRKHPPTVIPFHGANEGSVFRERFCTEHAVYSRRCIKINKIK